MSYYTLKELSNETCRSFGGNNCVLHQCMFHCALLEAKKHAVAREKGITVEELENIVKCKKA